MEKVCQLAFFHDTPTTYFDEFGSLYLYFASLQGSQQNTASTIKSHKWHKNWAQHGDDERKNVIQDFNLQLLCSWLTQKHTSKSFYIRVDTHSKIKRYVGERSYLNPTEHCIRHLKINQWKVIFVFLLNLNNAGKKWQEESKLNN